MFPRNTALASLALAGLLMSATAGQAQVPHTVIGQVRNSNLTVPGVGQLSFNTFLVDVSNANAHSENRTQTSPGNAYGNGIMGSGWFEVECGNFTAFDWSPGDSLVVNFSNSANGEMARLAVALIDDQEPQVTANVTLHQPTPSWSLAVTDASDPVWAGTNLIYTINYHNTGLGTATTTTILDTIPTHASFVSCTGGGSHQNRRVTWSLGTIPPGGSGSVTLTVKIDSPLPNGMLITDRAHISCAQGIAGHASQSTTVQSTPSWTFSLTDAPDPVDPGDDITYTINYQNIGTDGATGVTIVDTIPAHTSYSSSTGGGSCDGQRVVWSVGSVSAGAGGSVSLTVHVHWPLPNGTQIHDTAHLACSQGVSASIAQTTQVSADVDPPAAVTDLMSDVQGPQLHLEWPAVLTDIHGQPETVDDYIIYRWTAPYFNPTSAESIAATSDTFFVDAGSRAGDPDENNFYLVCPVDYAGNIGAPSNPAGEIDYRLPSSASGYTMISNSLDDGVTSLTTELGDRVPHCTAVKVWDAAQRAYVSKAFKVDDTWHGVGAAISGYPYYLFVNASEDSVWTLAGRVPADPTFQLVAPTGNDYNTITLPLTSTIALARNLGASIPYCTAVKRWDEQTQGYVSIAFKVGPNWYGNGSVFRGHPYYVNVTASSTWPSTKTSVQMAAKGHR